MCLIAVKPCGVAFPGYKKLKAWRAGHPDGFGLAFPYNGKVRIMKGALTERQMLKLIKHVRRILGAEKLQGLPMIFHFRQATSGSVSEANCHPFPLSSTPSDFEQAQLDTDYALAHNGVIWKYDNHFGTDMKDDRTDTQRFIEDIGAKLGEDWKRLEVQKLILEFTHSKFALLTPNEVVLVGDFVPDEGYFYSNSGYKPSSETYWPYAQDKVGSMLNGYWGTNKEGKCAYHITSPLVESSSDDSDLNASGQCEICGEPSHLLTYDRIEEVMLCPRCDQQFRAYFSHGGEQENDW